MLAPDVGSTNADDKQPLVGRNVFKRITNLFGQASSSDSIDNGYVEFGSIRENSETRTLGSFAGVFSPVTLSMFSALIFLRVGYLVGNAGLMITLLQFLIAYFILISTVASICAISTNGAVEGGGAYFMISRTLGPEFGGSIGTLFFLANIVSSAMCISGCVEGLVENFGPLGYLVGNSKEGLIPDGPWYRFLYCTILNLVNLLVCLIGAGMFAKTTVFVLATVVICISVTIISFFVQLPKQVPLPKAVIHNNGSVFGNYTGFCTSTLSNNLWSNYSTDYTHDNELVTFASVFGVLFSGVTGIMAGANMSGELKNPGKALPRGTLSAVGFTFLVYMLISFLTAGTCDRYLLQNNYNYMDGISVFPTSIAVGVVTATWSAALSNVIGASRVLEALSKDQVFGVLLNFIPKGTWRGNPIAAVVLSCALVQLVLLIGSLNLIAQLNSVLFLLSYLATNLACLGLELASAPNFRPSFTYFTWHTALLGLIGTVVMMFIISYIYTTLSILLCLILVVALHLFSPSKESQWGSISQALIFHQVRKYLLLLDSRKDHVKFWRPQVLLMINSPRSSCPLIDFINDLKKGGLYVLGHVVKGDPYGEPDVALDLIPSWLNLVDHLKVKAFIEITTAHNVRDGLQHLMRLSGMGAMKPNTVILGFFDKENPKDFIQSCDSPYQTSKFENDVFPLQNDKHLNEIEYVQMIGDVLRMKKNVCLCRNFINLSKERQRINEKKFIDIWPINFVTPKESDAFDIASLFMMQLACIVKMVPKWSKLTLRICFCNQARQSSFSVETISTVESNIEKLSYLLKGLRISAQVFSIADWEQIVDLQAVNPKLYLEKINNMIIKHSSDSALIFIYLPPPINVDEQAVDYLNTLETISSNLPPLIYVHGVSTVTSTTI